MTDRASRPCPSVPAVVLAVLLVVLSLSACGDDPAPSESAPGLAARLERVDEAIAAGDFDQARSSLGGLADAAGQARVDGRITEDQADEILDAVSATLQALATLQPASVPPEPAPDESEPTVGDEGGAAPSEEDEGKDKDDKDKGKDKGKGKDTKRDD